MIKTMIFLGAGASKADGAPLQKDLLKDCFERYFWPSSETLLADKVRPVQEFFEQCYPSIRTGAKGDDFPTLEEVLGLLEISAAERDLQKHPPGEMDTGLARFIPVRHGLVLLVARLLDDSLRDGIEHHDALVRRLNSSLCDTVFVSSNYDILIDNALLRLHQQIDYAVDYGAVFSKDLTTEARGDLVLLKPHGSLNWLYCNTCGKLEITPQMKSASELLADDSKCKCTGAQDALIVPPTFFKDLSNSHLEAVWQRLQAELTKVDRIIFCGYSLPDADFHLKHAFKNAELIRGKPWEIYLVNMYGKDKDRKEEWFKQEKQSELSRYQRFFSSKVVMTNYSFEEFSKDPSLIYRTDWDPSGP